MGAERVEAVDSEAKACPAAVAGRVIVVRPVVVVVVLVVRPVVLLRVAVARMPAPVLEAAAVCRVLADGLAGSRSKSDLDLGSKSFKVLFIFVSSIITTQETNRRRTQEPFGATSRQKSRKLYA